MGKAAKDLNRLWLISTKSSRLPYLWPILDCHQPLEQATDANGPSYALIAKADIWWSFSRTIQPCRAA